QTCALPIYWPVFRPPEPLEHRGEEVGAAGDAPHEEVGNDVPRPMRGGRDECVGHQFCPPAPVPAAVPATTSSIRRLRSPTSASRPSTAPLAAANEPLCFRFRLGSFGSS